MTIQEIKDAILNSGENNELYRQLKWTGKGENK